MYIYIYIIYIYIYICVCVRVMVHSDMNGSCGKPKNNGTASWDIFGKEPISERKVGFRTFQSPGRSHKGFLTFNYILLCLAGPGKT